MIRQPEVLPDFDFPSLILPDSWFIDLMGDAFKMQLMSACIRLSRTTTCS